MKNRKTNKAKQIDSTCKNNGSCPHCKSGRTYSNEHRKPADYELQHEEIEGQDLEDQLDHLMAIAIPSPAQ